MWLAAAMTTAFCFGANNTIFKWSTLRRLSKVNIQFFFYFVAFLLTLAYGLREGAFHTNWLSVILGTLIGILNANGNIQMARAFEKGPASLTSPIIAANAILPVLAAGLIFNEQIPFLHWLGVFCMMGSVIVIQYTPGNKGGTQYGPWIVRILLAFVSFGLLGILMKGSSSLHIHSLDMLVSMYGGGSVFLLFLLGREKIQRKEVQIGAVVGVLSVIGYSCYFYALQTGTASIVFPVVSLNCLVVILTGCYLFKERLKLYQICGICTALLGLVLTKI
ncbi:EamA-like transporter family protein [Aneurinibacillus soli]|uniref:4-amino-4-deoxy-L-arabinose-phosphoundecaprenol flippase subunit ArnE n=1 Tax=Aneurinibacillus soli TaxID=1500254 RepID=A0A0U4WCY3_9BACL|nr:DMT family transporter [Aneurinibacillus soli]PYE58800.1 EamA-like transporter family protein [Aneurinibacillus soli]BAU26665.1 4-amino-4-deoxy-L-arabinose-phosphoundecaprenol flippase subunit ArnE [Aneurinibacillus soli]